MGRYVYAPHADANHKAVKGWYEELYCSVLDLHKVGESCPDLLIGCAGRDELVEIKSEEGNLKPHQVTFHRDWRGAKVAVVRTKADVINHVMNIRERISRGQK
jgi:hypothetical protein